MDISPVSDRTKHPPQRGDASDDPLRDGPKGTRPRGDRHARKCFVQVISCP
ncbi:MAG: hypothetical protein HC862_19955 [Scytonema sp. RU_4_4]|nr:hypothetical protein [Scytonema sp. RU_4_4]